MTSLTEALSQDQSYLTSLNNAMDEVFGLMMGLSCVPTENKGAEVLPAITAVIGLAGSVSGACILRVGEPMALRIAECLIGVSPEHMDDTVKDAVGEVCNMIAGAWKGKIPALASSCMLSPPAVVTGSDYQLHLQRPDFRVDRHFMVETLTLAFSIVCETGRIA